MNRLNISILSALLFIFLSCKTDPQQQAVTFNRTGNSVVIRLGADAVSLNPILLKSSYDVQVSEQLNLYLINYDPITQDFVPELVKAIPNAVDITDGPFAGGLSFTFEIHDEAVWDDGSPVTGNDFVFTLKALFNPLVNAARYRAVLSGEIGDVLVDATNPKKFTVLTPNKTILSLETISNSIGVMPKYRLDPEGKLDAIPLQDLLNTEKAEALSKTNADLQDFATAFNGPAYSREKEFVGGCGPYELVEWQTGQRLALKKKANWWGDQLADRYPSLRAYPEELIYTPIPNSTTAITALKSEEIDVMSRIDPADFINLKSDEMVRSKYNFYDETTNYAHYFLAVNTTDPILSDKQVRKALAYAIDVDEIIDKIFLGYGQRVATPVHPDLDYYHPELQPVPFDIEKAKSILTDDGWEDSDGDGILDKEIDGERQALSIELTIGSARETTRNMAILVQDNARKAGIDVQLNAIDDRELFVAWRGLNYQLISAGFTITPNWNPRQSWHTEGDNRTGFGTAETDALIDKILVTLNEEERKKLYIELQEIIYDEQPQIYLFVPNGLIAIHKRFEAQALRTFPGFQPRYFKLKEDF